MERMFEPSRELREFIRASLDRQVRASVNYRMVERLEQELEGVWKVHAGPTPVSKDDVVLALRDWVSEHGSRPTFSEWKRAGVRPGYDAIRRRFGSWNLALEAAGIEPFRRKHATASRCANGHRWTSDSLYRHPSGKRVCRLCVRESRARRAAA